MSFKPMLAPNETVVLAEVKYPVLSSWKLDGIRGIFYQSRLVSRALKDIPNKQIQERFQKILKYCTECSIILDGEFYSPDLTFQQITTCVMTEDFDSSKTLKKKDEAHRFLCFDGRMRPPTHLKFYVFDCLRGNDYFMPFNQRLARAKEICDQFPEELVFLSHAQCFGASQVEFQFEDALSHDVEGLILRNPEGRYKTGRGTLKEALIFKVKPFETFDAKVTGVVQSTEVRESAEKKINELGRSVTSKKKEDRILIEKASAFWVEYEGKPLKVTLAMTDPEKVEVWKNRLTYIGKTIEYRAMKIGMKDLPRHPTMLRFREDKD